MAGVVGLEENELVVSACFMVLMNIFNVITSLPTSIYNTFVLEEKHGFNKQVSLHSMSVQKNCIQLAFERIASKKRSKEQPSSIQNNTKNSHLFKHIFIWFARHSYAGCLQVWK